MRSIGMRTIAPYLLALSLVCVPSTIEADEIIFEQDPPVTLVIDADSQWYSLYVYGAIGLVALYVVASFRVGPVRAFNSGLVNLLLSRA